MNTPKPAAPKPNAVPKQQPWYDNRNRPLKDHPGLMSLKRALDRKYPNNR